MDAPRYGTKAQCIATSVALIVVSGCLTRTITANFAPVYGCVAASETRESTSNVAIYAQLFLIHNESTKPLLTDKFELLCQVVIWWIVLLCSFERIVLFPMSRSLSVDWAIGSLVVPTKILLFILIMKMVLDTCPRAFRDKILSRDTGWKDVAVLTTLGVSVSLLMSEMDLRVGSLLEWLASARPALYLFLTYSTSVIARDNLQIYIASIVMAILSKVSSSRPFLKYVSIAGLLSAAIFMNPHLNPQLMYHGYAVLQRGESTTGLVLVLENSESGLRILRNDHSILGGIWLLTSERKAEGITYVESIFSAFYTLEAVRLIEPDASTATSGTDQMVMDQRQKDPAFRQPGEAKSALVM